MAATKAKQDDAVKAPRKKPVRKSPALKDYSSRLEWLKAMTEYETAQAEVSSAAKVKRLDKRIAAKQAQIDELTAEVGKLTAERVALVPDEEPEGTEPEPTEATA